MQTAVAGGPDAYRQVDIPGGMTSLVEKTLLRQVAREGESRFSMVGDGAGIRARTAQRRWRARRHQRAHAVWFLDFAMQRDRAALLPGGDMHLLQLETEHANVRAALAWFVPTRGW